MSEAYQCPDCSYSTPNPQQLGRHRAREHGHVSKEMKNLKRKMKKANAAAMVAPDPLQCPHCEFIAKWPGGLKHHIGRMHKPHATRKENRIVKRTTQATIIQTNGQAHQEGHANPDGIPDALVAVASGRFIELCRSVAFEYDLPPRLFAARVAAFIYGTQVR